jgi:hypothetical protein
LGGGEGGGEGFGQELEGGGGVAARGLEDFSAGVAGQGVRVSGQEGALGRGRDVPLVRVEVLEPPLADDGDVDVLPLQMLDLGDYHQVCVGRREDVGGG